MFDIQVNDEELQQKLERISEALNISLRDLFTEYLSDFREKLIVERLSGRPGVNRVTGNLVNSLSIMASSTPNGVSVSLSSSLPYAGVHDDGLTITAKGKKLTIPLPGVQGNVSDYEGFFFVSKKGNLLFGRKTEDGGLEPLFVLKDEVTIPARIKSDQLFQQDSQRRDQILSEGIEDALRRALA